MSDAPTSWADLLAAEVRRLEAKANGYDAATGIELFSLLRSIRGFETRVQATDAQGRLSRGGDDNPLAALKPPGCALSR